MMASSVINLILSIFGISVSSIFILFWCGRFLCAHFLLRRNPGAGALLLSRTTMTRRVVERSTTGVNPLVIASFPTISFNQEMLTSRQDTTCAVCLGEYKEDELLRLLPQCGHIFHVNCIDAWLQQHATCPVCRMSLQGYFVGRFLPPLQSMPPLYDQRRPGVRNLSVPSDAGSSGLLSARGDDASSLACSGAPEPSGSVLQSTGGQQISEDHVYALREDGLGSYTLDLVPANRGDRS